MIWPVTPLATASGLMMVSVRSTVIEVCGLLFPFAEHTRHRRAHVSRTLHGGDASCFERPHLLGRRPLAARDDRARVSHAAAGWRRLAADEAHHRLGHVRLDEGGRLLLRAAADLADHHDRFGLRIGLEETQHVDEARAVHRIAADADAGGLAQSAQGELVHDLVGERATSGDDTDAALLVDVAGHDPDLGLAW